MSERLLAFRTDTETEILVELIFPADAYDDYRGGLGEKATQMAKKTFDATLDSLKYLTQKVAGKLKEIDLAPDEITLELGVKINAEANVVLTQVGGETHMNLTLKWIKQAPQKPEKDKAS